MNKPDLRLKLSFAFLHDLRKFIDLQMSSPGSFNAPDDKIVLAALWEIRQKIHLRIETALKSEYSVKLSACQAVALHIVYTTYDIGSDPWFTSHMRRISDAVDQYYTM